MVGKDKNLCKWDSGKYAKNMSKFAKVVLPPKYLCDKCGRVASTKKMLCKPVKLED